MGDSVTYVLTESLGFILTFGYIYHYLIKISFEKDIIKNNLAWFFSWNYYLLY